MLIRQTLRPVKRLWESLRYRSLVGSRGILIYDEPAINSLYRDLLAADLYRELRRVHPWLCFPIFPAGGAADYKLIYLLGRVLSELRPPSVLEFGAGETTKLLSTYASHSGARAVTVEHDSSWVLSASRHSAHEFVHAPLEGAWYTASHLPEGKFEVVVVDWAIGFPTTFEGRSSRGSPTTPCRRMARYMG